MGRLGKPEADAAQHQTPGNIAIEVSPACCAWPWLFRMNVPLAR
jgi:hypothetical protein